MRVAIFTATSAWGGAEIHAVQLAGALARLGHEVSIVELGHQVFTEAKLPVPKSVQLTRIDLLAPLERVSRREACRIMRKVRPDVCVFEKGDLDAANATFDIVARWRSKSYVVIEQLLAPTMPVKPKLRFKQGILPGVGWWWYATYWRRRARSVGPSRIICVSEAVRERLRVEYHFPERKTLTIHNGVDPFQFRPETSWRSSVRKEWRVPHGALVFGSVGRLASIKRFDLAIELFRRFSADNAGPEAWFVVVGSGPAERELREAARRSGFGDRIIFPGATDKPWIAYNGIDIFLMMSQSEGLPLALLEAMASGCYPVAMQVGGVQEVILDASVGRLVPNQNEAAFVAAMSVVADLDPTERCRVGEAARAFAHPDAAADSGIAVSHIGGRALVARQDMGDAVIEPVERVVERQAGIPAQPEDVLDAKELQHADKGFRTGHLVHRQFSEWGWRGILAPSYLADNGGSDGGRSRAGGDRSRFGGAQPTRPRLPRAIPCAGGGAGPTAAR